jgi:hypothetical protein
MAPSIALVPGMFRASAIDGAIVIHHAAAQAKA